MGSAGAFPKTVRPRRRLADVATILMGQSPPSSTYNSTGDGIPFLQGKAEFGTLNPSPTKWCSSPTRVAPPNSILVSVRAPVGDANLADREYSIGRGLAAIVCGPECDPAFLLNTLIHAKARLQAEGSGTTFQSINRSVLDNLEVDLPPIQEQRATAAALGAIRDARDTTESIIQAARELKRSLMRYLFTYGKVLPVQAADVPVRETRVGLIPAHWDVRPFNELIEIQSGMVDPRDRPYRDLTHIGPENIEPHTGRVLGGRRAGELGLISGKYLFTERDILYSKIRPYLRKAALPTFQGLCSADMYALRPANDLLVREFLFHYLLTDMFSAHAISFQDRTGIPKINRQQLGLIPIPVPPRPEQIAIAEVLSSADTKIASEIRRRDSLTSLLATVLRELMTGHRRVQVGAA